MNRESGFTLIEALTAGIVSTVLAGVVLTLMRLSGSQSAESLTRQKISQFSRVVSEQIHATARRAHFVRSYDEPAFPAPPAAVPPLGSDLSAQTGLVFYAQDRLTIIGGYRLQTTGGVTNLLEYRDGGWVDFKVGNEMVYMVANQIFSITQNRRSVTFDARLRMTVDGVTYQHANPREVAFCRNTRP